MDVRSCQVFSLITAVRSIPDDPRYADPNPVPAARALLEAGAIGDVPSTRLVEEPAGDVYRLVEK